MPNQRLREMHAVRKAMAQGRPDTTRFRADTVDWLRGDTIIARFDTSATRDTTRSVRLRELVAVGSARSYHHMAAADSTIRVPAINYVVGREITVAFRNQEVAKVTVRERASGAYLEPKTGAAGADSLRPSAAPPRPTTTPIPAPAARPTARPPRPPR